MEDYYNILEVDPSSKDEIIRKSYRRLAKKYHPDRNNDIYSTSYMQKINNAYSVLCDPKKRMEYDYVWHKDISKKKQPDFKYMSALEMEAHNNHELQDILDRACVLLPNNKSVQRLARLHRKNPDTCSYEFERIKD